jgi:hypothetical protein
METGDSLDERMDVDDGRQENASTSQPQQMSSNGQSMHAAKDTSTSKLEMTGNDSLNYSFDYNNHEN